MSWSDPHCSVDPSSAWVCSSSTRSTRARSTMSPTCWTASGTTGCSHISWPASWRYRLLAVFPDMRPCVAVLSGLVLRGYFSLLCASGVHTSLLTQQQLGGSVCWSPVCGCLCSHTAALCCCRSRHSHDRPLNRCVCGRRCSLCNLAAMPLARGHSRCRSGAPASALARWGCSCGVACCCLEAAATGRRSSGDCGNRCGGNLDGSFFLLRAAEPDASTPKCGLEPPIQLS